ARRRAEVAGVEIDVVEGDARNLPFSGAQFDRVVSVATLCFSDDPRQPIGEMVRVLKPGGRLILGELGRWSLWAAQRRVKGWLGSGLWRAAQFRSRSDLLALAAGAGLQNTTVTGAIFYPPLGFAAQLMATVDPWIGRWTSGGAAFLVLSATKPVQPEANPEPT
ncbi:class I SAM-dependent methyltransferase, partial [Devosia sp.]|uniref:class I SAM-dependent methyltransferase n=1 Tax=Devosia sp. TaxID=1871048 RepID=UPI002733CF9D